MRMSALQDEYMDVDHALSVLLYDYGTSKEDLHSSVVSNEELEISPHQHEAPLILLLLNSEVLRETRLRFQSVEASEHGSSGSELPSAVLKYQEERKYREIVRKNDRLM